MDTGKFDISVTDNTILVKGRNAELSGTEISIDKTIKPNLELGAIDIVYTINNKGSGSIKLAVWEVSRVEKRGLTFFPEGDDIWYDTSDGREEIKWEADGGYIWFDEERHAPNGAGKLFADGSDGWMAHTDGDYLYVKQWTDVPANQAATGEAEIEIYDGSDPYIEIEVQGPAVSLASGKSTSFDIRWYVRPLDGSADVGDAELIAGVLALVEQ
jgi:hypothetical protein